MLRHCSIYRGLEFPRTIKLVPLLVMLQMPLNVFPPVLKSPVVPVFVKLVAPLNIHPFRNRLPLVVVTSPPNEEVGPKVNEAVPVKGRLTAAFPSCVNLSIWRYPTLKPAAPIEIVFPAARVTSVVALHPKAIPREEPVWVNMIFPLNWLPVGLLPKMILSVQSCCWRTRRRYRYRARHWRSRNSRSLTAG